MPDWLTELIASDTGPYLAVALLFILCGLGLPIPEEIVLVSAGFLVYQQQATYPRMVMVCAGAILVGDVVPFVLGSLFGPRLLRLRWMRFVISRQRLATFDRWFRRRGDMVILVARFVPGLRVVAFFTGGTMRMRWGRFLLLDMVGITLTAPTFVFVGKHFGDKIEEAFRFVQRVESSLLYLAIGGGVLAGAWYWLRARARRRRAAVTPRETFVGPRVPPQKGGDLVEMPAAEAALPSPGTDVNGPGRGTPSQGDAAREVPEDPVQPARRDRSDAE